MMKTETAQIHPLEAHAALGLARPLTAYEGHIPLINAIRALKIQVSDTRDVTYLNALCLIRNALEKEIAREIAILQFAEHPVGWKQIGAELHMSGSGAWRRYNEAALTSGAYAPKAPPK